MAKGGAALLMLLLVAGSARAFPVSGHLALDEPSLDGAATLTGLGALDLAPASGESLALRFASADGYRLTRSYAFTGAGLAEVSAGEQRPDNQTIHAERGELSGLRCEPTGCRALLSGDVGLAGRAAGALTWTRDATSFASGATGPGAPDTFYWEAPAGSLRVAELGEAQPIASGDVTLFLANASATLDGQTWSAAQTSEPTSAGAALPTGRVLHVPFIVLHLRGASFAPETGTRAVALLGEPRAQLDGALDAPHAEGTLRAGPADYDLRGQSLQLAGQLALGLAPPGAALLAAPRTSADVAGSGSQLVLDGVAQHPVPVTRGEAVATGVGLGLVALLAAWPLYTRLQRARILENANRRRIYDALRVAEGLTVAELMRATSLSEIVVRHHLKMLADQGLVQAHQRGKVKKYVAAEKVGSGVHVPILASLHDPTRRRLAAALVGAPVTQAELAARVGISARLVSYHLGQLDKDGLVATLEGSPRRHQASPRLAAYFAAQGPSAVASAN